MKCLLVLDGPLDAAAEETLRIAMGALAAGASVTPVASARTRAAMKAGDLSKATEDYLHTLAEVAPAWAPMETAAWRDLLRQATHILRQGSSDRPSEPPLCVVDEALLRTASDEELTRWLREAGQVVRVSDA